MFNFCRLKSTNVVLSGVCLTFLLGLAKHYPAYFYPTQIYLLKLTRQLLPLQKPLVKKNKNKKIPTTSIWDHSAIFSFPALHQNQRDSVARKNFPSLVEIQKHISQHHCGSKLSFQLEELNCGHLFSVTTREFGKTVKIKLCLFKGRQLTW